MNERMLTHRPDSPPGLVVIGKLDGRLPPGLETVAHKVAIHHVRTETQLREVLHKAKIVLLWNFRSDLLRENFGRARTLEWIHVAAAGVDAVMTPEIASSNVVVTNARGVFNQAIAETVVGMMLVFAKDMITTLSLQSQRRWLHRDNEMLAGRNALIIGAGEIGRAIGRSAASLGVEVIGMATSERQDKDFGLVRSIDDLELLLPHADFVILVLPLTDHTRGIIGAKQLKLMKTSARLINVGRGQLLDEDALIGALQSGSLAGAALDVFQTEPLPVDSPLWAMPNVIVSPHMSADFHGWLEALADQFLENLDRWLTGQPLLNVVDKKLGYVPGNVSQAPNPDS